MYALSMRTVKKIYKNGFLALDSINLNVQEGDFFALLGPNGAGKSTAIGILSSLINKTSGQVHIFDYDIDTQLEMAKLCIGVVPQEVNFNPFEKVLATLINQAGYYGVAYNEAIVRAEFYLQRLGLWDQRSQLCLRLSGGMKRRLMIARALMNQPRLLILDEPTAGVDIELRRIVWAFLTELNQKGTTIILTTHYLEEAEQLCNQVAIIDCGKIIEQGAMRTFLQRIKSQTMIIHFAKILNEQFALEKFRWKKLDSTSIEIEIMQDQTLNELFELLNQRHLEVVSMYNKTNRLEERFVDLIRTQQSS